MQNAEILKILISVVAGTLVGFIVGVSTEPIKIWFRNANDRKRLRNLVYQDLRLIYTDMVWLKYRATSGGSVCTGGLQIDPDRHSAARRDLILYSELPESIDADLLYRRISSLAAQPPDTTSDPVKRLDDMIAAFEDAIRQGSFSTRRLRKSKGRLLQTGLDAIQKEFLKVSMP